MMKKEPLQSDEWRKPRSKRNTKVFCKGKEGRYHQLDFAHVSWDPFNRACRPEHKNWWAAGGSDAHWLCFHVLKCSRCGKTMWDQEFRCPDRPENL